MGRTVLISRTDAFGDMWIPDEELLGVQLAQAIIHHVFFQRRFPEFTCGLFKVSEAHPDLSRIPLQHQDRLIDMGVGYMAAFMENLEDLQARYSREPLLISTNPILSNHVVMAV